MSKDYYIELIEDKVIEYTEALIFSESLPIEKTKEDNEIIKHMIGGLMTARKILKDN